VQTLDFFFTVIWIIVIFAVIRFLGVRFFNSPEKYRADVAALAVVVAFLMGLFWPFSNRAASEQAPVAGSVPATAMPAAICHTPGPNRSKFIRGIRRAQGGHYSGAIDALLPDPNSSASTQFQTGCNIYANGWIADMDAKTPVPGIGFLIDSTKVVNSSVSYGHGRPDVAKAYNAPGLVLCGYEHAEIPTVGLRAGPHTIQPVVLSKDGRSYHAVAQPITITLQ
jgi:hypothetical protein